jgi:hypothetical protein
MALEVDALVRSIEDEKIEEEQRERVRSTGYYQPDTMKADSGVFVQTRDVLARIEGINDRVSFPDLASHESLILIRQYRVHRG